MWTAPLGPMNSMGPRKVCCSETMLYVLYILLPLPSFSELGVPFRAMPLIGNGDIYSYEDYALHMSEAPFDAMMIGRYNIRRGRV